MEDLGLHDKIEIDNLIRKYNMIDKIIFLGYRDDVAEILQTFDVFVLPSRSEGLSISLLEAMASGRPVVATDVGMNGVIISNGEDGLIVRSGDDEAMAHALINVLRYPDFAQRMGNRAIATVRDKYSAKSMAKQYEDLYLEVVG